MRKLDYAFIAALTLVACHSVYLHVHTAAFQAATIDVVRQIVDALMALSGNQ
jgi:hypothetical protein